MATSSLETALTRAQHEAVEAHIAVQRAERRSQYYQLTEGESSTIESASLAKEQLTLLSHIREPWCERIEWYKGSTRSERPYSRRELALDAYIHFIGLALACIGCLAIAQRLTVRRPPPIMVWSVCLYSFSLVAMLLCSMAFNVGQAYWFDRRWTLRSLDHAGICMLIVGTYSPCMAVACTSRTMLVVGTIGIVSTAIKWSRGPLDRLPVHLCSFLIAGWSCAIVWEHIVNAFSPWATRLFLTGGVLYTVGLVPWALLKPMEFHICIWHIFVLVASGCFFAVVYVEILGIDHPDCGWRLDYDALGEAVSDTLVYLNTTDQWGLLALLNASAATTASPTAGGGDGTS